MFDVCVNIEIWCMMCVHVSGDIMGCGGVYEVCDV